MDDAEAKQTAPGEPESVGQKTDLDQAVAAENELGTFSRPEDEIDDFDLELDHALEQAYPELLRRMKTSYFADWHS